MSKRIGVLILVLTLLISNSGLIFAANSQTNSLENTITAIKVVGNKNIKDKEILAQIKTKVGDQISNQQLQKDMHAIFDLGYFFDIQVNFKNYKDGVMLIFEVIENPKLSEIKIKGNHEVPTKKLKEILSVKPNEILNVNQLDKDVEKLNKYYQEEGYVLAKVVDVTIKEKDKLYITVDEGRLNKILIRGNSVTKDYVIRRELSMKPGQVFNINQMWEDLRNVYNLGYFKDVKPKFNPVKDDPQAVNLTINVKEGKTGTFSIGGGYGSSSGWTGLINAKKDNLFGRGQRVKLNWEFGGEKTKYEIGFYEPWLLGTETSMNFNLYDTSRTRIDDTEVDEQGVDITFGHSIAENTTGYVKLNYNNTQEEEQEEENTRSITLKTIRDTTDSRYNPRDGVKQQFSVEKAGFGGDTNFSKYEADLRKYLPSGKDNSWAFRLKLAASGGTLSDDERYYLTGSNGIRGYSSQYYSDQDTNDDGTDDYTPEDNGFIGDSLLVSNVEYRFKIVDNITGIAFADAGKTYQNNDFDLKDLNYSVGLGARINTPIGQLGLDYGYAPEAQLDEKTNFSITIGNKF